jgi:2,3,4,5-tetrahydropyridine-2,6-dicarboxylate N-acetyltransferase
LDYKEIAKLIGRSKKKTPTKLFLNGKFSESDFAKTKFQVFGYGAFRVLIGDYADLRKWFTAKRRKITSYYWEVDARNSALPLADLTRFKARIEPGALIRTGVKVGRGCVIMMGAVINIGAVIGEKTMIDMNAVIGARAFVGKNCHIGAGSVVAGVLEPPSKKPVKIQDNVLVGANAVILEGVRIGKGSVVAAGAVVTKDIPAGSVAAGVPARVVKKVSEIADRSKTEILDALRDKNIEK